jgi:hypothetical protein
VSESRQILAPLLEHFNWTDLKPVEVLMMGDFFVASKCSNNTYDPIVTDDLYERMMADFDFLTANARSKMAEAELTSIWREIDEGVKTLLSGTSRARFTLIAGHDATLASILAGIGHPNLLGRPPYASHIAVELWRLEDLFIRFVVNGKVVAFEGSELTPVLDLKKRFSEDRGL